MQRTKDIKPTSKSSYGWITGYRERMDVTREGSGMLGRNQVREGMPCFMLELYPVGKEERHVQICVLPGALRPHHENELAGPKPALEDIVCRQLQ